MDAKMIGTIIILVLLLILIVAGVVIFRYIRGKVREFSRTVFRTEDVAAGLKKQELEYAGTPKSVSGATNLYLPQIMRDFPEFHSEEMKERAELVLTSYLQGITEGKSRILAEGTRELKEKLEMKIRALDNEECHERFERIKIHKTEIHKYRKEKGRCSVVYQSAIGCIHYVEKNGKIIRGHKDRMSQHRYNIEVCYIQDRDLVEDANDAGFSLICPRCGGAVTSLGQTVCPYCDSEIIAYNIRTWHFTDVEVVK